MSDKQESIMNRLWAAYLERHRQWVEWRMESSMYLASFLIFFLFLLPFFLILGKYIGKGLSESNLKIIAIMSIIFSNPLGRFFNKKRVEYAYLKEEDISFFNDFPLHLKLVCFGSLILSLFLRLVFNLSVTQIIILIPLVVINLIIIDRFFIFYLKELLTATKECLQLK